MRFRSHEATEREHRDNRGGRGDELPPEDHVASVQFAVFAGAEAALRYLK